jgi:sulfur relay (sulfurtransferase) complex TusBCD TusD component (DsrE family)
MKIHAWTLNLTSELRKKKNFDSSIFFHENSCKCIESHIWTKKKKELWKFNIFSWKFMQVHWISSLTSELRKQWTLKVQYFFMKIHASALNLTSELRKKKNFDSSIFFHENSCKCIESHIWTKKEKELWQFYIFSWKFLQVRWISHLN